MRLFCFVIILVLCSCATQATRSARLQCVPYARDLSGIEIYGNAHTWWDKAPRQNYARGRSPERGSVLVLSKTNKLKYGHVAVVEKVLSKREIQVSHANWGKDFLGRGNIYERMSVKDVSKNNDWSKVKFWSPESDNYGHPYKASGFVYKHAPKKQTQQAKAEGSRS